MKIAIIYGSTLGNTETAAQKIAEKMNLANLDVLNVAETNSEKLNSYDKIIFGSSTWGLGDLQDDWDNFDFKNLKVENKTVAIFGMGDSEIYPFTYCDSIKKLHDILKDKKANIVGYVSTEGYKSCDSEAVKDGHYLGLALDNENYEDLTDKRIEDWVNDIKKHFE